MEKILKAFFGSDYVNDLVDEKNSNAYFVIEPIYAFESCDYDVNNYINKDTDSVCYHKLFKTAPEN